MTQLFGPRAWIEDVCQSAMETFLRKPPEYRGEGSVEAYADVIALNKARDLMRRQARTAFLRSLVCEPLAWPAPSPDPSDQVDHRDRLRRLDAILERIGPTLRIPYLLYHVGNHTVPEIARIESISEAAVRKRISRARMAIHERARRDPVLREWLSGSGEE